MKNERDDLRKKFLESAEKMFDSMLPPEGGFPDTTINEIEDRAIAEGKELERQVVEARLELEGKACQSESGRCSKCGKEMRVVEEGVRRELKTTVGEVDYSRSYCSCDRCQVAFSPYGHEIGS